ncbi:MAG: rRNA pseudouridine synthase [Treponema sp.]|nr:rRNA pseudouridine synthase [Treponema sp.]
MKRKWRSRINTRENKNLRLQTYLAHAGIASRRSAEKLILEGRVSVNGRIITVLGEKVRQEDTVALDGRPVQPEERLLYLALHKPGGYLCSSRDPLGRPLARDLFDREIRERIYNVGRLDYLSSGLVIFTNDGDFAAGISHPSAGIEKEYLVEAAGPVPDAAVEAFLRGVTIEGVRYRAEKIERSGRRSLRIVLVEGKNRESRRVFSHFHLHPEKLHRIRIGPVQIGDLAEGASRPLTKEEMNILTAAAAGRANEE